MVSTINVITFNTNLPNHASLNYKLRIIGRREDRKSHLPQLIRLFAIFQNQHTLSNSYFSTLCLTKKNPKD